MIDMKIPSPGQVFPVPTRGLPDVEPYAEVLNVTPELAAEFLRCHVRNRPVKDRVVAAYMRDMLASRWQLTGEPVKFNIKGELDDGQHRLKAVVRSGCTVRMLVVWNVPVGAQEVMDSGIKRSVNDQLAMRGTKNASVVSAAVRLALSEPGAGFVTTDERIANPTNSEIAAWIDTHPNIHRCAEIGKAYYKQIHLQPSVATLAWMRLSAIDMDACSLFFHSLAEMTTDGPGDPRLALARRLQYLSQEKTRQNGVMLIGLVYRAWNAWRRGKALTKMPMTASIPERLY
ncbi:hypothetical protein ACXJJ3_08850 [Kribbella sp. WER1]